MWWWWGDDDDGCFALVFTPLFFLSSHPRACCPCAYLSYIPPLFPPFFWVMANGYSTVFFAAYRIKCDARRVLILL